MAIVGGFLGGGVEMVPSGTGQLYLQWLTPDRKNIAGASFTVNGIEGTSGSYTVNARDDGRCEQIVPVGTYKVSVNHSGDYYADAPQKVIVRSTETYLVLFGASAHMGYLVVDDTMPGATMTIHRISPEELVYSGDVSPKSINTGEGSVRIKITQNDISSEFTFLVSGGTILDLSEVSVGFKLSDRMIPLADLELVVGSYNLTNKSNIRYLKNIGEIPVTTRSSYVWAPEKNVTTKGSFTVGEEDIVYEPEESDPFIIESSGTYTLPATGQYYVLACGGGGGGGGGGGAYDRGGGNTTRPGPGGGGGQCGDVNSVLRTANQLEYNVTIGAGGAGGSGGSTDSKVTSSNWPPSSSGREGTAGGSTVVSGALSVSASGGNGGAKGGYVGYDKSGWYYRASGGKGGDGQAMNIFGVSVSAGVGGAYGPGTQFSPQNEGYGHVSGQPGSKGTTPEISDTYTKTYFNGSSAGGNGGNGGSSDTQEGSQVTSASGGYGGTGSTGLVVRYSGVKSYGVGGDGGNGGAFKYNSSTSIVKNRGTAGTSGTAGVVIIKMIL